MENMQSALDVLNKYIGSLMMTIGFSPPENAQELEEIISRVMDEHKNSEGKNEKMMRTLFYESSKKAMKDIDKCNSWYEYVNLIQVEIEKMMDLNFETGK
ncbi:MAG: hypothetical protein ATN31_05635 [Candidatus Epulonipiscioides saccharophilum]|nr:MAG: hypothetical protein ATN31_05635 [Epulopiscium sp. AS2M-Bin001]